MNTASDEVKLEQLVLYVAKAMEEVDTFGAVMLNKALFFSEMLHFIEYGHAITGAQYYRRPWGPTLYRMLPVQRRLEDAGWAETSVREYRGKQQKRFRSLVQPNMEGFSREELETIDNVIEMCKRFTATQISELSHQLAGWRLADDDEAIPFEAALLYEGPITKDDVAAARRIQSRLAR